ncbi:hypothetical protein A2110_03025 [Candidatus Jorgensenbacteria bacterium GWA1_54_12]|uniref:Oligogalacturonate lyase domain-containing protein n=1 Tax=Candidatus Jorgensenbacteria bacterium GWA1_54_12 TaxID=1798468 RepID=A0A1F6BKT1_9BACT|nr:MAG: hypothetical protein A2110_03025 [Candidatus Jorgensenbacteria bacterium GWA1_54_12]
METDFINRAPAPGDKARICLIDTKSEELKIIAETRAWNFHQGSRLQWMPGAADKIVYNDRDGNGFISVIMDVKTGKKTTFSYPVYAVNPAGDYGLGVNFPRLQRYGSYGYWSDIKNTDDPFPEDDGIFKVDFGTGEIKLVVSIHDIAHFENVPKNSEKHCLTHLVFNPSGTRVAFIHKWKMEDGGFSQRFMTMDADGTDIYCLPGNITHFNWKNDAEMLGYGKFSPRILALRKRGVFKNPVLAPLLKIARVMRGGLKQRIAGQSYLLFKDRTQSVKRIGVGVLMEDGHPSICPQNSDWFVTDTYPDKHHFRTLTLYNLVTGELREIGRFYSLPSASCGVSGDWDVSEMRSDLHPRWNHVGDEICFDSVHEGTKQMYIVGV